MEDAILILDILLDLVRACMTCDAETIEALTEIRSRLTTI